MPSEKLIVNGEQIEVDQYRRFHGKRVQHTLDQLRKLGSANIVEFGGHPWVMTSALIDDAAFNVAATISAEEVPNWPDDLGLSRREYHICTLGGREASFSNYSVN